MTVAERAASLRTMAEENRESTGSSSEPVAADEPQGNTPTPAETLAPELKLEAWNPSVPLAPMGFMRGGGAVRSSAYQKEIDARFRDAEHRRDQQSIEKKLASIPVDDGGGKMYSNLLAAEGEGQLPEGHVLLEFVNQKGEPLYEFGEPLQMVADIKAAEPQSFPGELTLVFFCPRCKESGMPLGECVLMARQSHRKWHLDARTQGELFVFMGHGKHEPGRSMGKVMDSDRLACPACNWACKIDNNKIWIVP